MIRRGWRNFAKIGGFPRQPVDVGQGKTDLALMRNRQQVQDRVGAAAHGNIHPHGIEKGGSVGNRSG